MAHTISKIDKQNAQELFESNKIFNLNNISQLTEDEIYDKHYSEINKINEINNQIAEKLFLICEKKAEQFNNFEGCY